MEVKVDKKQITFTVFENRPEPIDITHGQRRWAADGSGKAESEVIIKDGCTVEEAKKLCGFSS
jgi:hypothetical protein